MGSFQVEEPVHSSWSRFYTVKHRASNYQLSNMKHPDFFLLWIWPLNIFFGWRSQIPWFTKNCVAFCKWREQTDYDFGFVPLADSLLPNEKFVDFSGPKCPIQQHIAVRARGCPNFMGARIPVQSELNISEWQKVLVEYWDK